MKNKLLFLANLFLVLFAKAQTGGPGQPEFMQFQQAGTSNLVNPATGTFSYQIPLFTIGGYPMNLSYQSGIQMEDVASMVGLGWNLNAGSVVRTLRGIPDDFKGDQIIKRFSVKPNSTYGGKLDVDLELAGLPDFLAVSFGAGLGVFYNNYKGWGLEPSIRGNVGLSSKANGGVGGSASLGMGMSVNSQSGVDRYLSPSVGLKMGSGNDNMSFSFGKTLSVNSTEGLKVGTNINLSYVRESKSKGRGENKKEIIRNSSAKDKPLGDQSSFAALGLTSCSYLNNSFQPDIEYPFENYSGTYSAALGFDGFYVDPSIRVTGYYSKQKLASTVQSFGAYGTMYETSDLGGQTLMDFNTEKKLPYFIGESKILPIPYRTPDVFNLNGQGLSMSFSISKNDVGIVHDPEGIINSNGNQAGAEVNLGQLFKAGANFGTTVSFQNTGIWKPETLNTQFDFFPSQGIYNGNQLYHQFCFKNHGEINKFNHSEFARLGGYRPVQFKIQNENKIQTILSNGTSVTGTDFVNRNQQVCQSNISYLTAKEASQIGFDKKIKYFNFNNNNTGYIERVSQYRSENHLSEMSVTQPDGMKYIFGIPVYNTIQKEVTFNVSGNSPINNVKNLVTYLPGVDNTENNTKGIDNYFESTITPAYVTQFLITAVLSPDYRDITNDGITNDDLGNYVKFNYYKEDSNYNWRSAFEKNKATLNKGLRSDDNDDKGNYVYGEKELWYVHSIESKTEIAEYHYSKREDGYGVLNENGGFNANAFLRKLDYIVIYSLPDRLRNGNNAIPIKTIHFTYNYTLCKNIENKSAANTETGKLTLTKVSFTYKNSKKGKLSPYSFEYGKKSPTETINPDYDVRSVNRWGYYQKNEVGNYSDIDGSALSNIDHPYASQEREIMDNNAYAWNLTNITIPGGGKLKVDYEANDYGYIQDKTAGQMFKVTGVTFPLSSNNPSGNTLYTTGESNADENVIHNRIYFQLTKPLVNTDPELAKKELEDFYIKDIKEKYMYYKFYVKLCGPPVCNSDKYEYITGYASVKDFGLGATGYAYIDLELLPLMDDQEVLKCSPILKTAMQYMRINRNELVYNNSTVGTPADFSSFITSLPSIQAQLTSQIAAAAMGVNIYLKDVLGHCQVFDLNKSFIRLYNPYKTKIAGGSRVKKIAIDDNWNAMTGNTHQEKSYTTSFKYTTEEIDPNGNTQVISSGVADYEPLMGGDEISLKQPLFYRDKKKMAPDNDYFVEAPWNESLFPAPQITYGKVTQVTNETILNVGKTGKIVNEFFTAKDYPVKIARTEIDEQRDKTEFAKFQPPFYAVDQQHDFAAISQGYSIELNNMSGLPKATWVYNQNGDRISGEVTNYFEDNDHFTTIDRKGNILRNQKLGLSVEYTINGKKSYDKSTSTFFNVNLNVTVFGTVPIPIIMPLYSKMTEEKQFKSIAINKAMQRNGIIKSKTIYEQSSCITTENLAFDEVTGEVLLTKMANEFNDTIYSYKYPAWWMYEGMGPSYVNNKLMLNSSSNLTILKPFLRPGDELRNVTNGSRIWVRSTIGTPSFMNDLGNLLAISGDFQMYNSGAKNILSSGAGQIVTWNLNPLRTGNIPNSRLNFGTDHTLNTSAIEYYDDAVMYCDSCNELVNRFGKNDFLSGKKGNYKPKRTWFYLENRTPQNLSSGNTNIKVEGVFNNYSNFWKLPASPTANWTITNLNWEWKEKVNITDVDGQTLETEDRIKRQSANLLGYKNTLVIAQANNSSYGETYFDGFEDYYFSYCPYLPSGPIQQGTQGNNAKLKRATVLTGNLIISNTESHTGKYSLEVTNPFSFTIASPKYCKGPSGAIPDSSCKICIGGFTPNKNTKYVFSCWVKVNSVQPVISCADASVLITRPGMSPVTFISEGPVIEGWQRIMGTFYTPPGSNEVIVKLIKGNAATYFDDIRIFPSDGNMVSYVYDDETLRLTFSLDENNYFTKNEYNNQGELIRIKKETEIGIVTIKEGNSALLKKQQ